MTFLIGMGNDIVHLVWHYPVVCQTQKEDFFSICADSAGGSILSVKGKSSLSVARSIWRKNVHAQGRGFPFPELACLFARKSIYSPHNDTLGARWYTRAVRRFIYNRYYIIVSQTEYGRQNLIRQGVRSEKIKVLPIPVDYGFFSKPSGGESFRKKHRLGKEPFALVVGVRPVKNPDIILEACRIAGIKAILVGPCKAEDANKIWKDKGVNWYLPDEKLLSHKNAVFVGQLSADELRDAMSAATMFINSSDYESFGLAAYEAAAAGLPLCLPKYEPASAGNQSFGTFEGFRGCALFHKPKDADALANNIEKYLLDARLKKRNGRQAKGVAVGFDHTRVKRLYEKFYLESFGKR